MEYLRRILVKEKVVCYTSLRALGFDDFSDYRMELDRHDWGFL